MKWFERSYSGNLFRPRPEIHFDPKAGMLIVATPWGPRSSAKKTIQIIQNHILASLQDNEATSPFSRFMSLAPVENDLRIAVQLVNESIFNEENKNELLSGIELFVMILKHNMMTWVQIGSPTLFRIHPKLGPQPMGTNVDLSVEFSPSKVLSQPPPLPAKILGTYEDCDFSISSIHLGGAEEFILLSHAQVPLSKISSTQHTIEAWTSVLAQDNAEAPFWIGHLIIDKI